MNKVRTLEEEGKWLIELGVIGNILVSIDQMEDKNVSMCRLDLYYYIHRHIESRLNYQLTDIATERKSRIANVIAVQYTNVVYNILNKE